MYCDDDYNVHVPIFIKKKSKKSNTLETKIHHMIRFLNIGKRIYFKCIDESMPDFFKKQFTSFIDKDLKIQF